MGEKIKEFKDLQTYLFNWAKAHFSLLQITVTPHKFQRILISLKILISLDLVINMKNQVVFDKQEKLYDGKQLYQRYFSKINHFLKYSTIFSFQISMERPDFRLLSSLRDLRLASKTSIILTQQRKRKQKKLCPIGITPEDEVIYEKFKMIQKTKTIQDISFIIGSLAHHFTFCSLITNKDLQERLIQEFRLCKVEEGEYLIEQHDNASSFFILQEGHLLVQVDGVKQRQINVGEGFGELALLYSSPRSASILASKESLLWFIDRSTFRSVVSTIIEKSFSENKKFVDSNKFFSYLTPRQKEKIASIAMIQRYQKGGKICKEGERASAMYIVKKGKLKRSVNGFTIGYYTNGDSLEEYTTLSKNSLRRETIVAVQNTQLIALGAQQIEKSLGRSLPIIILRNSVKEALSHDKNFKLFSKQLMQKVIDCFQIKNITQNEWAFQDQDQQKNNILFVIEGEYELTNGAKKQEIYGTESFQLKTRFDTFGYGCKFLTEGKIASTGIEQIEKAFGFSLARALEKSLAIKKNVQKRRSKLQDLKNISKEFALNDFSVVKKLGEGQFGLVYLVVNNKNERLYALKCVSKAQTIKYKLEKHLINEKKVLESHSSAFTVDFIRSFSDTHHVYFLTEFINGMDLFDAMRVIGLVPVPLAKFYAAIMVHTLESLHKSGIVYRDLKPQNMIVCVDGYLKIIDMGTCKNLRNSTSNKTFTIIGTPNYMAPEILSGKGYNYSVDLWSMGIVLFEFLSGYLPFGENCQDPYQIYEQILKTQLKFPKYMKDPSANSLIMKLLNRSSESRIGSSYSELKNHEFFREIEWNQLLEKSIVPSFKPPKQSLLKIESVPKNLKPIGHYLKNIPISVTKRPDLNPSWDNIF